MYRNLDARVTEYAGLLVTSRVSKRKPGDDAKRIGVSRRNHKRVRRLREGGPPVQSAGLTAPQNADPEVAAARLRSVRV